jgi:hypothetical protein
MSQLCQIAALSASSRWMTRAHRPAGMRPPWLSRPSWLFSVQMTASTRWRSQFGNGRGCFSSLRAGRIRVRPRSGPAKGSSVPCPDRPLSVTTAVPGAGRFAGWRSSVPRAWSPQGPVGQTDRLRPPGHQRRARRGGAGQGEFRDIPLPKYVSEAIDKHVAEHGVTSDGYLFQGPQVQARRAPLLPRGLPACRRQGRAAAGVHPALAEARSRSGVPGTVLNPY